MRRPVKPFVTEYKAPNRRSPSPTGVNTRRLSEDFATSAAPHDGYYRNNGDGGSHSEDAYEAALRAADALFAPSPRKATVAPPDVSVAEVWGDRLDEQDGDLDPKGGGRVLRAIDEEPSPALAALEVERAPKRRGRKPGSKNKPKIPPLDSAASSQPHYPLTGAEEEEEDEDTEIIDLAEADDDAEVSSAPAIPLINVPAQVSRRAAPYSWIRRKLAPGEQWKRRLPKVCW